MKWRSPDTAPQNTTVLVWGRPENKPRLPLGMQVAMYEEFEDGYSSWTLYLTSDEEELEVYAWMPLPDPPPVISDGGRP